MKLRVSSIGLVVALVRVDIGGSGSKGFVAKHSRRHCQAQGQDEGRSRFSDPRQANERDG